ncbi:MAG: hypothetical protein O7F15_08455 [Gammaproteobacteria bacterium]|nr:hypothetical protein [Gammaproteobacteria bacterium]
MTYAISARVSILAELKIACVETQYRLYIYKNFLVRYNSKTRSRQIFIQQTTASGTRYERDLESLFLKGTNPPLYLIGNEKIRCKILNTG